jgi:hypothetical protein
MPNDETLNPADPTDAKLLDLKSKIESAPDWAETKQRIERDNFLAPGSSDKTNSAPDKYDERNAELKANFESGKGQETPVATEGPTPAESSVIEKLQAEMGTVGYVQFYKDAQAGLAQYKTWEQAEAAMLGAGLDPNDPEDVEAAYRFMAQRGAKLRVKSRR